MFNDFLLLALHVPKKFQFHFFQSIFRAEIRIRAVRRKYGEFSCLLDIRDSITSLGILGGSNRQKRIMGVSKYLRDYSRAWVARIHLPEPVYMHGVDGIGVFHAG